MDEQMPLTLPDTQNADILTPMESQEISDSQHTPTIWGRLCPQREQFETLEMTKEAYTVGRAEECDVTITNKKVKSKLLGVISKIHFRIIREYLNGNPDDVVVYLEDCSHNGTFINKNRVGRGQRSILENNDIIAMAQPSLAVYIFMSTTAYEGSGLPPELKMKYAISRTLGTGACGEVKMVFSKKGCERFAMKMITKQRLTMNGKRHPLNDPDKIMNEVRILKALRHPCIIRMQEIVDTPMNVYIVLELMEGGELFERIRKKNGLTEKSAKLIFYQVALAVKYLHNKGITHRDLKPENILLASDSEHTLVKVTDFGLSKFVDHETMMMTFCGTPMYVAPEILLTSGRGAYTSQVDIWSMGVILYCCLSGLVPFSANDRGMSLQEQIMKGIYRFPAKFDIVTPCGKELITEMLTVDPDKRIKINKIVTHSWLRLDREMQRIVDSLLYGDNRHDENTQPSELAAQSNKMMNRPHKRQRIE